MDNRFKKVMSERNDDELIRIVTIDKGRYNPMAIEAAEAEIKRRNIDINKLDEILEIKKVEKNQKDIVDSNVVSSGIRFINFIIDTFIWFILVFIFSFIVTIFIQTTDEVSLQIIYYFVLLGTFFGYYAIMEIRFQKTVGKFITKTKVVKMNGSKPETSDIITRTLYRFIPMDQISFLFVKNGIHDYLSKTKVVKDEFK